MPPIVTGALMVPVPRSVPLLMSTEPAVIVPPLMSDSDPAVCVNVCPAIAIADRGPSTVMLPAFEKPTLGARNWADPVELVFVVMAIVPSLLKPVAFIWK